jgi:hypothetical protein
MAIAQALFGQAMQGNQKMIDLINTFGPLLMASILFSMSQDWAVDPNDPDTYTPRRNLEAARDHAMGILTAVYAGMDLEASGGPDTELNNPNMGT